MPNQELILLAHAPTESVNDGFLPAARRLGLSPLLLTDQAEAHRQSTLAKAGCRPIRKPSSPATYSIRSRSSRRSAGHGHKPVAVFSNSDHLQASTAIAAEYFGLPGKN